MYNIMCRLLRTRLGYTLTIALFLLTFSVKEVGACNAVKQFSTLLVEKRKECANRLPGGEILGITFYTCHYPVCILGLETTHEFLGVMFGCAVANDGPGFSINYEELLGITGIPDSNDQIHFQNWFYFNSDTHPGPVQCEIHSFFTPDSFDQLRSELDAYLCTISEPGPIDMLMTPFRGKPCANAVNGCCNALDRAHSEHTEE